MIDVKWVVSSWYASGSFVHRFGYAKSRKRVNVRMAPNTDTPLRWVHRAIDKLVSLVRCKAIEESVWVLMSGPRWSERRSANAVRVSSAESLKKRQISKQTKKHACDTNTHEYVHIHVRTRRHASIHSHTHTHTHTSTLTSTHVHTHVYTSTQAQTQSTNKHKYTGILFHEIDNHVAFSRQVSKKNNTYALSHQKIVGIYDV